MVVSALQKRELSPAGRILKATPICCDISQRAISLYLGRIKKTRLEAEAVSSGFVLVRVRVQSRSHHTVLVCVAQ
jgi:hypothetical protein